MSYTVLGLSNRITFRLKRIRDKTTPDPRSLIPDLVSRILDPGSRFPDLVSRFPDLGSQIPYPTTATTEKGGGICCPTFNCGHKYHQIENYLILNW